MSFIQELTCLSIFGKWIALAENLSFVKMIFGGSGIFLKKIHHTNLEGNESLIYSCNYL
jgi:hypothetical protein